LFGAVQLISQDELTILSDEAVFHPEAKVKPEWKRDERRTKLQLMGFEIQRLQLELDEVVSHIPSGQLNEARILLGKHHKLMDEMFTTYLKDNKISGNFGDVAFDLPEWLNGPQYALPGGSLLVREDDPSSIIAHTLS
jgi:1-phosphatidylinositol-3-phosphate 5-kinase